MRNLALKIDKKQVIRFLAALLFVSLICVVRVFAADEGGGGDAAWTEITELVKTWVIRIGAFTCVIGVVMFGLAWQRNEAENKTRAIATIVGGAIVIAAPAVLDKLVS
ncbi:hypothetical protein AGMMS49975_17970 [Clostridia bacterium]|nr:hypothetical protein AGMMS49975_17970 [Clostridia bacterium]